MGVTPRYTAQQRVAVYPQGAFVVTQGAAEGDGLSIADDLVMDDIYQLARQTEAAPLALDIDAGGAGFVVAAGSPTGRAGNPVVMDCCATLMAPSGAVIEVLVLVEVEAGAVAAIHLLPLAGLVAGVDYRLVGVDRHAATRRFAQVASVAFVRGTHITLATGAQVPIEALRAGDRVLTRDDGPQPVRWVGQTTQRADGPFAPVLIKAGALHNTRDLVLSPEHRLFVYQRQDRLGAGRSEVLVKVRHLVNGDTVIQQDGGFVDYFQLLFDQHHIIYAEGIAAESMLIDARTRAAVPGSLSDVAAHGYKSHFDYEVHETLLSQPDAVALLRRASSS